MGAHAGGKATPTQESLGCSAGGGSHGCARPHEERSEKALAARAAVAAVAVAVGPVGSAMADGPEVTITSPPSPLNGNVINNPTPSFEGTGDADPEDGGPK